MNTNEFYDLFEEYEYAGFSELPIERREYLERRERERAEFELVVDQCHVNAAWAGTQLLRAMCYFKEV